MNFQRHTNNDLFCSYLISTVSPLSGWGLLTGNTNIRSTVLSAEAMLKGTNSRGPTVPGWSSRYLMVNRTLLAVALTVTILKLSSSIVLRARVVDIRSEIVLIALGSATSSVIHVPMSWLWDLLRSYGCMCWLCCLILDQRWKSTDTMSVFIPTTQVDRKFLRMAIFGSALIDFTFSLNRDHTWRCSKCSSVLNLSTRHEYLSKIDFACMFGMIGNGSRSFRYGRISRLLFVSPSPSVSPIIIFYHSLTLRSTPRSHRFHATMETEDTHCWIHDIFSREIMDENGELNTAYVLLL